MTTQHFDIQTKVQVSTVSIDKQARQVAEYVGTPERRSRLWGIMVDLVDRRFKLFDDGPTRLFVKPNAGYNVKQAFLLLTAGAILAQSDDWFQLTQNSPAMMLDEITLAGEADIDWGLLKNLQHEFVATQATKSLEAQLRDLNDVSHALHLLNKWRANALEKRERLRQHDPAACEKLLGLVEQINSVIARGKSIQADLTKINDALKQHVKDFAVWSREVKMADLMAKYLALKSAILTAVADSETLRKDFLPSATFIQDKIVPEIEEA